MSISYWDAEPQNWYMVIKTNLINIRPGDIMFVTKDVIVNVSTRTAYLRKEMETKAGFIFLERIPDDQVTIESS